VGLLIDTDLLVGLERAREPDEVGALLGDEPVAVSVITVSELLHGVHRATETVRITRRAFVEHLLAGLPSIPVTDPVARVHAEIWAALAARGTTIGAHDLWIAATALAHGLGVATRNAAHFGRVPGLRVVAPAQS
jgi:tRNA(fMet)-specific endonuclease VapC